MYNLMDYGEMLRDSVRVRAFGEALKQLAPGARVLELGGGTGFFACLASKLGASHVTTVDLNPLLATGVATAQTNRVKNIDFVIARSQETSLEQPADIIVHDLRGNTPFFEDSMKTLKDAARFLAPGGVFLPRRDRLYATLVEDPAFYAEMEGIYGESLAGIDLSASRPQTHRLMRYRPSDGAKHWSSHLVADVHYHDIERFDAECSIEFRAEHSGLSHGLIFWFETELTDGVGYSTNPWHERESRAQTYGVAFLPWPKPIRLTEGESYRLDVAVKPSGVSSCALFKKSGSTNLRLGDFDTRKAYSQTPSLPLSHRFEPHSTTKTYRRAFKEIERGSTVKKALQRMAEESPHIRDPQTLRNILLKAAKLVQASTRPPRTRTDYLGFHHSRIRLTTDDSAIRQQCLERLQPAWKTTKAAGLPPFSITLQEVVFLDGSGYALSVGGSRTLHDSTDLALDHLEALALRMILSRNPDLLVVECRHYVKENKGVLDLGGSSKDSTPDMTVLDCEGHLIPYSTTGLKCSVGKRTQVSAIYAGTEVSIAFVVAALTSKSLSNRNLKSPISFFRQLIQNWDIIGEKPG